ncbi:MAG TPA: hypothetical protein VFT36_00215 [Methylomirabilota bacterium]|nr:hypothetical protein [Methylomirabilota bacterium]
MDALPGRLPPDGVDVFTGLVCPDCRGSLAVRLHRRHAAFICRVGHSFSEEQAARLRSIIQVDRPVTPRASSGDDPRPAVPS